MDAKLRETIRAEYITRNTPLGMLAKRYGVDHDELTKIAQKEDWSTQRDEHWRAIYDDVIHNTRTAASQLMARTVGAADRLVRWADSSLKLKLPEDGPADLDPKEVGAITQALRTGLDVLKFTLGGPEDLLYSGTVISTEENDLTEALEQVRELLQTKTKGRK